MGFAFIYPVFVVCCDRFHERLILAAKALFHQLSATLFVSSRLGRQRSRVMSMKSEGQPELGMFSDVLSGDSSDEEKEREARSSMEERHQEVLATGLAQKYASAGPLGGSNLLSEDASTFQLVAFTCFLLGLLLVSHTMVRCPVTISQPHGFHHGTVPLRFSSDSALCCTCCVPVNCLRCC